MYLMVLYHRNIETKFSSAQLFIHALFVLSQKRDAWNPQKDVAKITDIWRIKTTHGRVPLRGGSTKQRDGWIKDKDIAKTTDIWRIETTHVRAPLRGGSTKQRDGWIKDKDIAKTTDIWRIKTTHVRAPLRGGSTKQRDGWIKDKNVHYAYRCQNRTVIRNLNTGNTSVKLGKPIA